MSKELKELTILKKENTALWGIHRAKQETTKSRMTPFEIKGRRREEKKISQFTPLNKTVVILESEQVTGTSEENYKKADTKLLDLENKLLNLEGIQRKLKLITMLEKKRGISKETLTQRHNTNKPIRENLKNIKKTTDRLSIVEDALIADTEAREVLKSITSLIYPLLKKKAYRYVVRFNLYGRDVANDLANESVISILNGSTYLKNYLKCNYGRKKDNLLRFMVAFRFCISDGLKKQALFYKGSDMSEITEEQSLKNSNMWECETTVDDIIINDISEAFKQLNQEEISAIDNYTKTKKVRKGFLPAFNKAVQKIYLLTDFKKYTRITDKTCDIHIVNALKVLKQAI